MWMEGCVYACVCLGVWACVCMCACMHVCARACVGGSVRVCAMAVCKMDLWFLIKQIICMFYNSKLVMSVI